MHLNQTLCPGRMNLRIRAIAEERKCTEESQSRTTKLESQLKAIKEEQKAVQPLRLELEVGQELSEVCK